MSTPRPPAASDCGHDTAGGRSQDMEICRHPPCGAGSARPDQRLVRVPTLSLPTALPGRRSVAPSKAGRGTRGSPGSPREDGWRRRSACAQSSAGTRERPGRKLCALAQPRSKCGVVGGLVARGRPGHSRRSREAPSPSGNCWGSLGVLDSRGEEGNGIRPPGLRARFGPWSARRGPVSRGTSRG